jgi:hypothetical protein
LGVKTDPRANFFAPADASYLVPTDSIVFKKHSEDNIKLGQCSDDEKAVISLGIVDLESGQASCVTKGVVCAEEQISVGYRVVPKPEGSFAIDMVCASPRMCYCNLAPGYGWAISEIYPNKKYAVSGTVCGQCSFVFPPNPPAQIPATKAPNSVSDNICPSKHYSTTVNCQREPVITRQETDITLPDGSIVSCAGWAPPGPSNFAGTGSDVNGQGLATCSSGGGSEPCGSWYDDVQMVNGQCDLEPDLRETKDATLQ